MNLGDVIVEDGGDIFGEGINVAARLEGIAEPGSVFVSEKVYREIHGKIDVLFDDIGEQQLKNISKPLRVYAARQPPGARLSQSAVVRGPSGVGALLHEIPWMLPRARVRDAYRLDPQHLRRWVRRSVSCNNFSKSDN